MTPRRRPTTCWRCTPCVQRQKRRSLSCVALITGDVSHRPETRIYIQSPNLTVLDMQECVVGPSIDGDLPVLVTDSPENLGEIGDLVPCGTRIPQ